MEKIDIKTDIRYVVATMDVVPMFLVRDALTQQFYLSDNVTRATKGFDKESVRELLKFYKSTYSDFRDFTILPIEVSYKILDGDNYE